MCGICGVISLAGPLELPESAAERMIGVMSHRGPDEFGAWRDDHVFLGHARLSIIDLKTGQQPLSDAAGRCWITFNGEIFNYIELREELEGLGHLFRTGSDTEVIVASYLQWGRDCVEHFNGQFAFAIWDAGRRRLFLARDRFGIRPLFLAEHEGSVLFASEIKSLAAWPGFKAELRPESIAEIFTYWVNIPPRTAFKRVAQLPPGHTATLAMDESAATAPQAPLPAALELHRYWHPEFLPADEDHRFVERQELDRFASEARDALVEASTIRLRADVPVGAYLSGGLDSSATSALIHRYTDHYLKTFSVGFTDPAFDETKWQLAMADHLGTEHRTVTVDAAGVADSFADVVWHAETPILRTAPAPLHALSALVRSEDYKVVLTGEGADEVFVGYNIFREAKVRDFWRRDPASSSRFLLLSRLYPYLEKSPPGFLRKFYGVGLDNTDDPWFSHRPRWNNTGMMTAFLHPDALVELKAGSAERRMVDTLPTDFGRWGPVARAQYVEMTTFLSGYLLSSQGDRMLMGNSVEGRFPFLDHNVAQCAAGIPASAKLQSLVEKAVLKESVADLVPPGILKRSKQPYRAPDSASFLDGDGAALAAEIFTGSVEGEDIWLENRVASLYGKWRAGRLTSARENMGFIGIFSARILACRFGPEMEQRIETAALKPDQLVWR